MAAILIFDPNSTPVANRIVRFLPSANTPDYDGRPDVLVNPTIPQGLDLNLAKVDSGQVVALTVDDLAAIEAARQAADAAAAAAEYAAMRRWVKDQYTRAEEYQEKAHRAAIETVLELTVTQINVLRAQHSLAALTADQVKTAFTNNYKARIDALLP